ncbi:biliverdin-producing heme oxygenase [Lentzea sp. NBRC 102530]|uniref:biliverdin-producing heme oxygenase n=1 Tax=Lentzea sp. NBRC 102530 TaxID=3032201 RepID=UPI0024A15850|nr:biliverdin-producing heme oxygenase [Lentzea sp. NBRC 102530]GLY50565.1 heme oxygenase BphO [Lentzea sp. NBRC 102530]
MTLLARLRTETRAAHLALEDDLGIGPDTISRARYEDLLATFLGFHEPLERALAASIAAHDLHWELLPGAAHLRSDLSGLDWSAERIDELRRCVPPDVSTLPRLIGALYVVEGARLGGQVITRWVADALGPVPVAFFGGNGDARRRFRGFGAMAEAALPAAGFPAASDAANACFSAFRTWSGHRHRVQPAGH